MNVPIALACQKCGSQDILIPSRSKEAIVTCNSCHAIFGKWGAIQAAALAELKRVVRESLKDS
jgi:uncharacterized Zn finger protein